MLKYDEDQLKIVDNPFNEIKIKIQIEATLEDLLNLLQSELLSLSGERVEMNDICLYEIEQHHSNNFIQLMRKIRMDESNQLKTIKDLEIPHLCKFIFLINQSELEQIFNQITGKDFIPIKIIVSFIPEQYLCIFSYLASSFW